MRLHIRHRIFPGLCFLFAALLAVLFHILRQDPEKGGPSPVFPPAKIATGWREGDLIFRIGTNWQSEAVRGANQVGARARAEDGKTDPYSHVGLLVGSPEHWQVLHSTPAEKPERSDGVVLDDLAFFAAPERARGIALYRVAASASARAAAVRFARSRLGQPFRLADDDTEGRYCTTFVWRAWREAGVDLGARFERVGVFFDAVHYLFPSALRRSPSLELLYEQRTEESRIHIPG